MIINSEIKCSGCDTSLKFDTVRKHFLPCQACEVRISKLSPAMRIVEFDEIEDEIVLSGGNKHG